MNELEQILERIEKRQIELTSELQGLKTAEGIVRTKLEENYEE